MRSEAFWTWFEEIAPRLREWPTMARDQTFRKMFEHLDSFVYPVSIVETGCVEESDNWAGNGCSTILFNKYIECRDDGSFVHSLELDPAKVFKAEELCSFVIFYKGDSVETLEDLGPYYNVKKIDLLYLDASNHDWVRETTTQVHHFR